MQVVVQADDGARLAVATISLDHLATLREPLAPVRLDEDAALVAVDRRLDDVDAVDHIGRDDVGHRLASLSAQLDAGVVAEHDTSGSPRPPRTRDHPPPPPPGT